jgi:hypothetical protein
MASTDPSLTAIKGWIFSHPSGVWGGLDGIEERELHPPSERAVSRNKMLGVPLDEDRGRSFMITR